MSLDFAVSERQVTTATPSAAKPMWNVLGGSLTIPRTRSGRFRSYQLACGSFRRQNWRLQYTCFVGSIHYAVPQFMEITCVQHVDQLRARVGQKQSAEKPCLA